MRASVARAGAGIDGITLEQRPVPEPGLGEALVRITAATLNYRDLLMVRGDLPGTQEPDYVPLSDGAGEVVALGDGVTRLRVGDRVSPLFAQGWFSGPRPTAAMLGGPVDGVARDYGVFDAESLCLVPDELGDLDAAALPCGGLTAWSAIFGPRPVRAGDWVLVQGTGGVALAALQWAKASGAQVVITSSSDAKLARAKALGADIAINYRTTADWPAATRAALGGRGVDLLVDNVGANGIADAARAVGDGGIIAAVGRLSGADSWGREAGVPVVPVVVGNRVAHEAMLAFAAHHGIRPVIDRVYDLAHLPDALRRLESGRFCGKIAVGVDAAGLD